MKIREIMIESIAEFELMSGNEIPISLFEKMSDEDILKMFRNNIWDEAYTDGHVEGYFKGIDHERQLNRQVDLRVRLN